MELSRHGLSPEHSHVLHILVNRSGSATLKEIARVALIQPNTASVLVRKMEKLGLLERNRREGMSEYEVKLTEKGQTMASCVPRVSIEMIFGSLSADEKRSLAIHLSKLDDKARHVLGLDYSPPF
jgi:DNA-binding MarR family transcriptional regulator